MFQKIALALVAFTLLISGLASLSTSATDAELVQNNSKPSPLWAGDKPVTFPSDENLTNELIDEEQDSYENDSKPVSICGGNCPITGGNGIKDMNYLQNDPSIFPKSTSFAFATSVLRFVVFFVSGLSWLAILGGLVTTIFLSIKRKKFALKPFLVFVGGICILVVTIICLTIINLTSF